jgi:hypothetical protein
MTSVSMTSHGRHASSDSLWGATKHATASADVQNAKVSGGIRMWPHYPETAQIIAPLGAALVPTIQRVPEYCGQMPPPTARGLPPSCASWGSFYCMDGRAGAVPHAVLRHLRRTRAWWVTGPSLKRSRQTAPCAAGRRYGSSSPPRPTCLSPEAETVSRPASVRGSPAQ